MTMHPDEGVPLVHLTQPRRGLRALVAGSLAAFLLLVGAAPATAADEQNGVEGKSFIIATDTTFAPFEMFKGGEVAGIDMDLLKAIAESQGFEFEVQSLGFQAALSAVTSGQADGVIAGMSITDERKEIFDFSDPYFDSGVQMAVAAGDDEIAGYDDLEGETVVAKSGSEGLAEAQKLSEEYGFTVKALDQS